MAVPRVHKMVTQGPKYIEAKTALHNYAIEHADKNRYAKIRVYIRDFKAVHLASRLKTSLSLS